MDIRDLRTFVAIASGATLGEAAQRLHQTPSALSKALRRLERALDTELFDRSNARLRLNEAGARLLPWALDITDRAEAASWAVAPATASARLHLAGPAVLQWRWAAPLHARLLATWPNSRFDVTSMYEDDAVAALRAGHVDAALVTREAVPEDGSAAWVVVSLGRFRMVLATGRGGAGAPIACTSTSPLCGQVRQAQSESWHRAIGLPAPLVRVDDVLVLVELVREGAASALLPDFLVAASGLEGAAKPLPDVAEEEVVLVMKPAHARAMGYPGRP